MEGVSDNLILEMAKRIEDTTKFITLAVKLGFTIEEAERFYTMNRMNGRVSTDGTRRMLCRWRENTPAKKQWATLEAALIDTDLAGIADEFSKGRARKVARSSMEIRSKRGAPDPDGDEEGMVEGRASKVPRSSVEIRSKPIRGASDPDGDEEELSRKFYLIRDRFLEEQQQLREQLLLYKELQDTLLEVLERSYTDPDRFEEETLLQKRDFQPGLKRRDSSSALFYGMENSRHDIFLSPMARKHRRRITVSGSNTAKLTALCHSLAYDWATQNRASGVLLEQQLVFELSANDMKPNQTIENAIKHQLFPDHDDIDEALIRQLLKDIPDAITILLDGFNDRNCGENIMDVLSGRTLQEVTVMVTTTQPRSANLLDRMGVYDRIDMY